MADAAQPVFQRGALRSPRHKLAAATPHSAAPAPASYGIIPKQLAIWGNSSYGDCVSAEECFNIDAASTANGLGPAIVSEQEVIQWARQHGFLNGANLSDVMDQMQRSTGTGMTIGSVTYYDGPYQSVDWTNQAILSSAIFQSKGSVKIAVAADQLSGANAGSHNGWYLINGYRDRGTDHCVGLCGYGTAAECYQILGMPVPSAVDPTAFGVLLFTWSTVGFVDWQSLQGLMADGEAWLRSPISIAVPSTPPPVPAPPASV